MNICHIGLGFGSELSIGKPAARHCVNGMLSMVAHGGAEVALCATCLDACGITEAECIEGARRGSMEELATWTLRADKLLVF